ncbi:uncharacterized protein TM35_000013980 [Trypanosoma theileri]|uniref:Uncharacterized protein n=1 Tax=Trypanosoma theileri TaxID=67003 RepID=A0A1X0P9L1_9TRYP|nr:uncharacterized protein TM35_000013980 [Trypanosoma theileri]ORC93521.1 hypothetical protein TM35_000013980 [Trypanosoma theileri]
MMMMLSLRRAWNKSRMALWEVFFPERFISYIDPFVRLIFTLYHLPFIALIVAITHSELERIVWVLIVPVAQEMEKQPYNSSHMETFLLGLYDIFRSISPFFTLGLAVATVGHKVLNSVVETMVDAHCTHCGKHYPLLAARLAFVMENKERYTIFLVVFFLLVSIVLSILHTNILLVWTVREPIVMTSLWCIIAVQFCFVVGSFLSHKSLPPKVLEWRELDVVGDVTFTRYICDVWWRTYIQYMRYIAVEMVIAIAGISLFYRGPLYVLSSSLELAMYLNLPLLVGHAVLSISTTIMNLQCSFRWLRRHFDVILPVLLLAFPYQIMLLQSMFFFRNHWRTVFILTGVSVLLCGRAVDLVREFDVSKYGSVHWKRVKDESLLPPYLSILLEDAYERKTTQVGVVSLDMFIDMKGMMIYSKDEEIPVKRIQVHPYGNGKSFLRNPRFYTYTVPRLLSVQSSGYIAGEYFRKARSFLRHVTSLMLILFTGLVCGMLLQAAFPQLRPWPVRIYSTENKDALLLDHIVVRMGLFSSSSSSSSQKGAMISNLPYISSSRESPFSAFMWNNVNNTNNISNNISNNTNNITLLGDDWYPSLCTRSFYDVSIWEISLLALAPYLFYEDDVKELLQFMSMHMGTDWRIRERHGTDCISTDSSRKPTGWDGYYEFYSAKNDLSVISIRGTDMTSFKDLLIDVNIYFDVVLYHILSNIVPGAVILPSEFVADLLRLASIPASSKQRIESWKSLTKSQNSSLRFCANNNYGRDFFVDVYNHLSYIGTRPNPPKHVLLTGHSLGGAVASIIGSQMGIKAVGFSAPGIALSRKKYNIDLWRIHKYVVTVISSHDIVPMIGGSGGEEHHVECLAKTRELCHAVEFLVGTLWRSCESIRSRYPLIKAVT